MICRVRTCSIVLCILLYVGLPGAPVHAQVPVQPPDPTDVTRPWITVVVPATNEGDTRSEVLAGVIADNLELTLRLIGDYVVRPRPTARIAPRDPATTARYAEAEQLDYVVFGSVAERPDGTTLFTLSVYSREEGTVTLEREATAETVFDTFDVADELAVEVLGAFTGQRIAYGRIDLVNVAEVPGEYVVYVDGEIAGSNLTALERVLVGERQVEIVALEGPEAGLTAAAARMTVAEGAREELRFLLAAPEPEVAAEPEPEPAPTPEPEIAEADEPPEIPLDLRVYRWSRWDPGRDGVYSLALQFGTEFRLEWENLASTWGMRFRYDWGASHSAMLGYELSGQIVERDEGPLGNPYRFSEEYIDVPLAYEPLEFRRIFAGYGWRFRVADWLTAIPTVRFGLERDLRLVVADMDGDLVGTYDEWGAVYNDDYEYGDIFWVGSVGLELPLEVTIRRFLLYGTLGWVVLIPGETEYDLTLRGSDSEDNGLEFPFSGTISRSGVLFVNLGVGYTWGGDEATVNAATPGVRTFRAFEEKTRTRWGLSLYVSGGASALVGPVYVREFPEQVTMSGGVELARETGLYFGVELFTGTNGILLSRWLYRRDDGDSEPPEVIDGTLEMNTSAGSFFLGRRLAISDRWFIKPGIGLGGASYFARLETDSAGSFEEVESGGIILIPRVTVEQSFPGTAATAFGRGYLLVPGTVEDSDYAFGFGNKIGVDGRGEAPPAAGFDLGVMIRLAGTPPRLLAEDAPLPEWISHGGAGIGGTRGVSGPEGRNRIAPRLALGSGVEWLRTSDDGVGGFQAVFPAVLRFPFGLELGVQGSFPLGERGISGPRRNYDFVADNVGEDEYFTARPRLNRAFSLDVGYRFYRDRRLSVRPGLRTTSVDYELWEIENRREDGTVYAGGENRFSREKVVPYGGGTLDLTWAATDRLSLQVAGGILTRIDKNRYRGTPDFSREIWYEYPDYLGYLGLALMMEL